MTTGAMRLNYTPDRLGGEVVLGEFLEESTVNIPTSMALNPFVSKWTDSCVYKWKCNLLLDIGVVFCLI